MKSNNKNNTAATEQNNNAESLNTNGRRRIPSKRFLFVILAIIILIGSYYGIRWFQYYITHASTDDARIKGDLIRVSPTVQGKIRLLPIREGEHVAKGRLVAQLREEDYQAKADVAAGGVQAIEAMLKEARADLILIKEKTQKEIQRAVAVLSASRARLNEAKANLRLAVLDFERSNKLYQSKTVSTAGVDKTRAAHELAQARLALAGEEIKENQANLQLAKADIGAVAMKQGRIESLHGKLEEARASLELANLQLAHTTVTSPINGVVAKKVAKLGEVVKAGQPIAVIVDLDNVWVEANLEETKVEYVRLGQIVDLSVDAYPKTRFAGKVVNIGAAAASEFSLIPENRSAGSFTKVTQRIPIKIEVLDATRPLRPGMMVVVGIDIRDAKNGVQGRVPDSIKK